MRRRAWLVAVAVAVAAVGGGLIANGIVAADAAPVPSACPTTPPGDPGYTGLLASELRLVPFTPEHVLLCRYNGMNGSAASPAWALAGIARLDGAKAARLAASTNAAARLPSLGVVSCPAAVSSSVDAYFWDSSHRIRVRLSTSGCETADNGGLVRPSIAQSDIVPMLERLTARQGPGTVRGTILRFDGPVTAGGPQPTAKPVTGIVIVYRRDVGQSAVSGTPIARLRTPPDGTFSFTLPSGRYFVVAESLTGAQLVEPQPITLAPGGDPDLILGVKGP